MSMIAWGASFVQKIQQVVLGAKRSPRWPATRDRHLLREPTCIACDSGKDLEVHHIVPVHVDATRELDADNLVTLCRDCHYMFGHFRSWSSWNVLVRTDAGTYLEKLRNRP